MQISIECFVSKMKMRANKVAINETYHFYRYFLKAIMCAYVYQNSRPKFQKNIDFENFEGNARNKFFCYHILIPVLLYNNYPYTLSAIYVTSHPVVHPVKMGLIHFADLVSLLLLYYICSSRVSCK